MIWIVIVKDIAIFAGDIIVIVDEELGCICRFDKITYFNLRGVCDGLYNFIDGGFCADMQTVKRNIDEGIEFTGQTKSKMVLDKEMNIWTIVSLLDGSEIMSLESEVDHL